MKILATVKEIGHTGKTLTAYVSYTSDDGEYASSVQVPFSTAMDKGDIESQIEAAVLAEANLTIGKGALVAADIIVL